MNWFRNPNRIRQHPNVWKLFLGLGVVFAVLTVVSLSAGHEMPWGQAILAGAYLVLVAATVPLKRDGTRA